MFFRKKRGVECLFLAKNNDRFVYGPAGFFVFGSYIYEQMLNPPLKSLFLIKSRYS